MRRGGEGDPPESATRAPEGLTPERSNSSSEPEPDEPELNRKEQKALEKQRKAEAKAAAKAAKAEEKAKAKEEKAKAKRLKNGEPEPAEPEPEPERQEQHDLRSMEEVIEALRAQLLLQQDHAATLEAEMRQREVQLEAARAVMERNAAAPLKTELDTSTEDQAALEATIQQRTHADEEARAQAAAAATVDLRAKEEEMEALRTQLVQQERSAAHDKKDMQLLTAEMERREAELLSHAEAAKAQVEAALLSLQRPGDSVEKLEMYVNALMQSSWAKREAYTFERLIEVVDVSDPDLTVRHEEYKTRVALELRDGEPSSSDWENKHSQLLFHGCSEEALPLIAKQGFRADKQKTAAGQWQRFGPGYYFALQASKSHEYPPAQMKALPPGTHTRSMLLCKVIKGKVHRTEQNIACSCAGTEHDQGCVFRKQWVQGKATGAGRCHAVLGIATERGPLNYDELVVYDTAAILPWLRVTYEFRVVDALRHAQQVQQANAREHAKAMRQSQKAQQRQHRQLEERGKQELARVKLENDQLRAQLEQARWQTQRAQQALAAAQAELHQVPEYQVVHQVISANGNCPVCRQGYLATVYTETSTFHMNWD
jgi:hypothetical protein